MSSKHQDKKRAQWIEITPDEATRWLEKNPNNRDIRSGWVRELAKHMLVGPRSPGVYSAEDWDTPGWDEAGWDAIAFDVDGNLLNGQHRLRACVLAGVPFINLVIFGLPRKAGARSGDGVKWRTPKDRLHITGKQATTIIGALCSFSGDNDLASNGNMQRMMDKYSEQINLVTEVLLSKKKNIVSSAAVRGAFLRALIATGKEEQLGRWAELLYTPEDADKNIPGERNMVRFLNNALNSGIKPTGGHGRGEIYRRLSTVLRASFERRTITDIRPCSKELFELDLGNGQIF
jgi:hypothetical protein